MSVPVVPPRLGSQPAGAASRSTVGSVYGVSCMAAGCRCIPGLRAGVVLHQHEHALGYRFGDSFKLGLPLLALFGAVAIGLVPVFWSL